jgi:epoxide hydrolase-like predicted phosphatase
MIQAIVFDVGGVLCSSPIDEFTKVDREYGLPAGTVMALVRGGDMFARCETGRMTLAEFNAHSSETIAAEHGVKVPTERLESMFHACMGDNIVPEMRDMVMEIKRAGYQTGLLTNIFAERRAWLHSIFPAGTIDVYADSSELGLRKPELPIYERLLEMLGKPAEAVVFVDDFPENIAPARALGMVDILFSSPEQARRQLIASGVRITPGAAMGKELAQ